MEKSKKLKQGTPESAHAYGANKHVITEVESDALKDEGYVIEQLQENAPNNK